MILQRNTSAPHKKTSPFIGFLLFLISILLLALTGPLGFLYGIFYVLFTKGFHALGEYFLKIAISIDQLGNVLMQHLLNVAWVKKGGYLFGNRDETISSAIGKNKQQNTLTGFGRFFDRILDAIDPDHSLNSIDYFIQPEKKVIDKLAWIHIVDGRILSTRSKGKTKYYIPGGKRESGESDSAALIREIKEELCVEVDPASLSSVGIFEAQADGHAAGITVRMTCYTGSYTGKLCPDSEIEEMVWLNYKDKPMIAAVDLLIFDYLKEKGELL
ncbi:NUDIX hydrolase [Spongiimicrobium salis]|uniref:NUDIX hydrolase n=1 Tax=Spongiimicrobium salis TaxID=1667022 RepID=UPI00374D6DFE